MNERKKSCKNTCKKKSIFPVLLLLIFFIISTFALSAEKPGDLVDQLFARWDKPDSPGCAVAVIHKGEIIYKKGYGMADLEHNVPITPKTHFKIGSVSKHFVSFCVLLLESRGKLSLDDDIRKFFPEMPDFGVPVTIRHLGNHTSGLRGFWGLMLQAGLEKDYYHSAEEAVRLLARRKGLLFTPGERFVYCNTNYLLLGEIVRRVSGKSLRQFADENIFQPLGMKDTLFYDNHREIVKNRTAGYVSDGNGGYMNFVTKQDLVGAGGLITTVEDLFLWDQNFYHPKVGDKELLNKLVKRTILNDKTETRYGFGLGHKKHKGLNSVLHTGSNEGFRSSFVRFPGQRFSVICLGNLRNYPALPLCYRVADIYLKDQLKETKKEKKQVFRPVKLSRKHLANKTGAYRAPGSGEIITIKVHPRQENRLLYGCGGLHSALAPAGKSKFRNVEPGENIALEFVKEGKESFRLYESYRGGKPVLYEPVETVCPTREELKEYEGDYYNDELETIYRIVSRDGKLTRIIVKKLKDEPGVPLEPTIKDEFLGPHNVFQFLRDDTRNITGFYLDIRWLSNLKFRRIK